MALHTYTPYEWKNAPDHKTTPLSADNLNHIEQGIKNAEDDIAEVADMTKHGIVELWENPSPANQMAGQTIQIANFDVDKYDAVIIPIEKQTGEVQGNIWYEFDVEMFRNNALVASIDFMSMNTTSFGISRFVRNFTLSMVGTTLNIQVSDNTLFSTTGGAPTSSTNNYFNIPYRVLGLIHND